MTETSARLSRMPAIGDELYFENWLGGTYTPVTITGVARYIESDRGADQVYDQVWMVLGHGHDHRIAPQAEEIVVDHVWDWPIVERPATVLHLLEDDLGAR